MRGGGRPARSMAREAALVRRGARASAGIGCDTSALLGRPRGRPTGSGGWAGGSGAAGSGGGTGPDWAGSGGKAVGSKNCGIGPVPACRKDRGTAAKPAAGGCPGAAMVVSGETGIRTLETPRGDTYGLRR